MTTKPHRSSLALTVTVCAALSALSTAGCASAPPQPAEPLPAEEGVDVVPPPDASAPLPPAAPTPSAALAQAAPVDRKNCQPHPPAVKFEVKDDDVVVSRDAAGCPLGESHFKANGYSYKASVDFMTELQRRLKAGDKKGLSELVTYPLRVNYNKGPLMVKDRAAFLREFDQIYYPGMVELILKQDPRDVSCGDQGIMLGLGFIWAAKDQSGHLGVTSVNPLG